MEERSKSHFVLPIFAPRSQNNELLGVWRGPELERRNGVGKNFEEGNGEGRRLLNHIQKCQIKHVGIFADYATQALTSIEL